MDYAIIAAGQGSRLSGEGEALPKPLVRLGDEPMIGRLVGILASTDAGRISVIVNEQMPDVASCLEALSVRFPLDVTIKSTGGSMESFYELSKSMDPTKDFCLMTVDTVFDPAEFRRFIEEFEADDSADGYMAVTDYVADEKPLYVGVTPGYEILGFLDSPVPEVRYVSGGIYALRPSALAILADCHEAGLSRMRDFQRALVAAGMRLKAWPFSKIIDVDHVGDLEEARRFLEGI